MPHVKEEMYGDGSLLIETLVEFLRFIQVNQHFPADRRWFPANELQALVSRVARKGAHSFHQRVIQEFVFARVALILHTGRRDGSTDSLSYSFGSRDRCQPAPLRRIL